MVHWEFGTAGGCHVLNGDHLLLTCLLAVSAIAEPSFGQHATARHDMGRAPDLTIPFCLLCDQLYAGY
jgi:hypothetical protein